ncbi:MAG: hypothetical protein CBARDCOR_5650 [uncultured Caballeronia sp.]|nr:MAG: hypothetical protein CBARDCOR_5650 [uncultured Caballeronia sp.]
MYSFAVDNLNKILVFSVLGDIFISPSVTFSPPSDKLPLWSFELYIGARPSARYPPLDNYN